MSRIESAQWFRMLIQQITTVHTFKFKILVLFPSISIIHLEFILISLGKETDYEIKSIKKTMSKIIKNLICNVMKFSETSFQLQYFLKLRYCACKWIIRLWNFIPEKRIIVFFIILIKFILIKRLRKGDYIDGAELPFISILIST